MTEPQNPGPGGPASGPPPSTQPTVAWGAASRPETPVPGTAGLVFADVPNRVIGLIIDGIILAIVTAIVTGVVYGVVGQPVELVDLATASMTFRPVPLVIGAIISLLISAAYYVYTWTTMRSSPGHKVLGMQIGNFPDGATLTPAQALRRWAALFAPFSVAQVAYVAPALGALLGLATFAYAIFLLYTTAQSPTKQGFHDKFANTVVVKAARTI